MQKNIGFIGAGNMGSALVKGIIESGIVLPANVHIYDADLDKVCRLRDETGINAAQSNSEVVQNSDIVILAVKPNVVKKVLEPLKDSFDDKKILVSIAVGVSIKTYSKAIGKDKKIVRTMPNTPALVKEGMTLICANENIDIEELAYIKKMFESVGMVGELDEGLMNEVTALTGSSPAYVYIFIEAMADAAVQSGIPRNLAYRFAAQAVFGSAKMVIETGKHPAELKDQVCSPAGTTIEAVSVLEKNGFRHAVIEAMDKCTKKAREIGGKE